MHRIGRTLAWLEIVEAWILYLSIHVLQSIVVSE